jgi:C4-dicarboxylate-specific signal transduction histidine kinase
VNTTTSATATRIRRSKVASLGKAAQLLSDHSDRLPEFLSSDPRGRQLPAYLNQLATHLETERDEILAELQALQASVDHIKEMVAAQQQHARVSGITEIVPASELVEYALHIAEASLKRHHIVVNRELAPALHVRVERHKALQIIGNLIGNAKDALNEADRSGKTITLGVRPAGESRVQIYVADNGTGISPENLTRVFAFGFTTKKTGHGFGLHSSALAAEEMGGSLRATSDGPGRGATFLLELPTVSGLDSRLE